MLEPNPDVFSEYGLLQNEIPLFSNALAKVKLFKEDTDDRWAGDDDIAAKEKRVLKDKTSMNAGLQLDELMKKIVTERERGEQSEQREQKAQRTITGFEFESVGGREEKMEERKKVNSITSNV